MRNEAIKLKKMMSRVKAMKKGIYYEGISFHFLVMLRDLSALWTIIFHNEPISLSFLVHCRPQNQHHVSTTLATHSHTAQQQLNIISNLNWYEDIKFGSFLAIQQRSRLDSRVGKMNVDSNEIVVETRKEREKWINDDCNKSWTLHIQQLTKDRQSIRWKWSVNES